MEKRESFAKSAQNAMAMYRCCKLCERRCGVNRIAGERGFCGAGTNARLWRYGIDFANEKSLCPSLEIFLAGCDLRCAFCISEENSVDPQRGRPLTSGLLQSIIDEAAAEGARNLQWLGGEPTVHLPAILQTLAEIENSLPLVWKSNFYGTPEAWKLLKGLVDCYVADFKYGNNACARRISQVDNYVETISRNLLAVSNGSRLIIRHLLLPGHYDCCFRPIVAWMRSRLPETPFSIHIGYLPRWKADSHAELNRPLTALEVKQAQSWAVTNGLNVIE